MMPRRRAGLGSATMVKPTFAPVTGQALGNQLPGITGEVTEHPFGPGPGPNAAGGQLGAPQGKTGASPQAPKVSPGPGRIWVPAPEGGIGQPLPGPADNDRGIIGFNDRLTVRDRHGYWDRGTQRTGNSPSVPGNPPNPVLDGPVRPDFRTLNRSLSFQLGSDNTANQDDLSRGYTWLGEQGAGWAPVYGGAPGVYQPYGTRGGVPYPIAGPQEGSPQDGQQRVFSGPPHGLHSQTLGGQWQTLQRYGATPQQRPVRVDRPSNSPQAGQSYSQTVQTQGQTQTGTPAAASAAASPTRAGLRMSSRGWTGA